MEINVNRAADPLFFVVRGCFQPEESGVDGPFKPSLTAFPYHPHWRSGAWKRPALATWGICRKKEGFNLFNNLLM